ncbi:glycosyl hydrolase [Dawidia soli]|uniref:Beta-mannosidase-like galactose-binding domain-containing protein n=1 Tax=Dawidia soli TaxID=2782352 RepID=A0AAP2GG09_9BACT|nr:glycosyl hydrolase [Dawidia soli]MBT1685626.1 hypothetical protein [Dawidia soli]
MIRPSYKKSLYLSGGVVVIFVVLLLGFHAREQATTLQTLRAQFLHPPDDARPGVYWYFMDGSLSKEGMTADLESMKQEGIGSVLFLEVNVGVPRGKVDFLSEEWKTLFAHAVHECERLGIEMTLGVGPGWTGSGGPWVTPAQSMQHLVSSSMEVDGSAKKPIILPVPLPKRPFFGEDVFTPELKKQWRDFYEDVAVLAFPAPAAYTLADVDEKALYYRAPYTSQAGVKQYLSSPATYPMLPAGVAIDTRQIIDLTGKMAADGTLSWTPPPGKWLVMRFGRRNNGSATRPAPLPGLGFECDKFDTTALHEHLQAFTGALLQKIGARSKSTRGGLTMLHMDSWEMGAQNWSDRFRAEFQKRRGYDPLLYYPVYAGKVVGSLEVSERFLWDLRQTSQELIVENHAKHLKHYSHRHGLGLSIEPYDMNPTADLELGAVADVPMCEFWSPGGYNAAFSCLQAASLAHVNGQAVVAAEAFTAVDGWRQHPASMKNQGDWAFAAGINKYYYHTFQHQPLAETLKPGMTMGPYGVQWNRNQTWWPLADAYHTYVARCQHMLRQGRTVADILYLTPENAPHVFRAPASALSGDAFMPDRKGYNFDACSPGQLYSAVVKDHQVIFPGGASYRVLVLPAWETMTPALLQKIKALVEAGATVVGTPPRRAPGLSGYPQCDATVRSLAVELWGATTIPATQTERRYGNGKIVWGGNVHAETDNLYPRYDVTARIVDAMGIPEDFNAGDAVRYTHRTSEAWDIYFVSNRTDKRVQTDAVFRTDSGVPSLWDPVTGKTYDLPEYTRKEHQTLVPVQFEPYQSYFIVFDKRSTTRVSKGKNFPTVTAVTTLSGPWHVSFDTVWGGPGAVQFDRLVDWTQRPEKGVKYYSGLAVYTKTFDLPVNTKWNKDPKLFLNLGEVHVMARVRLNGKEVGTVWTTPWKVDISDVVRNGRNTLAIDVVNLWPNRLIGDEQLPDDGIQHDQWPAWLVNKTNRTSGRYTFSTFRHYSKDDPLFTSGLLGPVTVEQNHF